MDRQQTIIVIEDEEMVQQSMLNNLTGHGFAVYAYDSAEKAFESSTLELADAVIMDISLPGMNGWEATQKIKEDVQGLPVLMVTAFSDLNYRIQGFETGADDYIIKPFFMEELVARLRTVLKRYELIPGSKNLYVIGDLEIDTRTKMVTRAQQVIKLSATEFNLLALLALENGNPISKEEIMKKVWKGRYSVGDNTIEVYINLLRNKVDKPFPQKLIHTKPGFGYYLAVNL
ncbi:MAG: response regulator transcription factor [Candidatus Pseudobacter hemicellulosilyticus]|uniref:Response regulator transcription factor n=1 Tax=Candidatus Pseudobacter hemicellulosilyticus TaxID=3121375 RepID=A0AAJ5WPF1_9BACT|nr:MAG: response regulator transcription factor [Pseudobacter sp.]